MTVINKPFVRPKIWPERKPLVKILSFSLLENHYHLFLKEIKENGISLFTKNENGVRSIFLLKFNKGIKFEGNIKIILKLSDIDKNP